MLAAITPRAPAATAGGRRAERGAARGQGAPPSLARRTHHRRHQRAAPPAARRSASAGVDDGDEPAAPPPPAAAGRDEPQDFWEGEQWEPLGKAASVLIPLLAVLAVGVGFFASSTYEDGATVYLEPPKSAEDTARLVPLGSGS